MKSALRVLILGGAGLAACLPVPAALTTVAQSKMQGSDGKPVTGYLTIAPAAAFTASDGVRVETAARTVRLVNGAFSAPLEPTDTATPANVQYVVTWQIDGAKPRTERWQVPTATSVLGVNDVLATPVTATTMLAPGQISGGGAAAGQCLGWSGASWGPAVCGSGSLAVKSEGVGVGTRGAINFIAGAGLIGTVGDDGSTINIQLALDTAVAETQPGEQSGSALLCASGSGSTSAYTCAMSPTLAAYRSGMMLHWKPDVAGAGGATTLDVDTLGATPVVQADGVTNPTASTIAAGQFYTIWYDGSVFRLGGGGSSSSNAGLSATCSWSTIESGLCGAGSLTTATTWAQMEAM